jgi:hypothetical protein
MDAGINNVIYMELLSGPKMVSSTCGKMIIAGMIDGDSTVLTLMACIWEVPSVNPGQDTPYPDWDF